MGGYKIVTRMYSTGEIVNNIVMTVCGCQVDTENIGETHCEACDCITTMLYTQKLVQNNVEKEKFNLVHLEI